MRKLLLYITLLIAPFCRGQQTEFESGNAAYALEDYKTALIEYGKLLDSGYLSPELLYNTGNAYYRNGEIGKAIWAYEKALKIDPTHEDASHNLKLVHAETVDKIDNTSSGIGSWLRGILFGSEINFWSYIAILASILFSFSLIAFFLSRKINARRFALWSGAISGLFLLFSLMTAHRHKSYLTARDEGIVIVSKVDVKHTPIESSESTFKLHEGSKVLRIGGNAEWVHVEVNGNSGWIPTEALWEI